MKLREYINKNYETQVAFAKAQGVSKTQVQEWLVAEYIVIDHTLYSKRRDLKTKLKRKSK